MYRKKGQKRPKQLTDKSVLKKGSTLPKAIKYEIVLTSTGRPFRTEKSAVRAAKKIDGGIVVQHDAGFAVKRKV